MVGVTLTSVSLYIPIWLYSNYHPNLSPPYLNLLYIPIWLYSNTLPCASFRVQNPLYIPIWLYSNPREIFFELIGNLFTFQSGYIQIWDKIGNNMGSPTLHSNLVIFKLPLDRIKDAVMILYIPIWLYSNDF